MHTNPIRWQSLVSPGIVWLMIGCQAEPGFEAQPSASPIVFTAGHNALTQMSARMVLRPRALDAQRIDGLSPAEAVHVQLSILSDQLGLERSGLQRSEVLVSQRLASGGSVIQMGQRAYGLPLFQARASLTLDAHNRLVSVASQLSPKLPDAQPAPLVLTPEAALARLYNAHTGLQLSAADVAPGARPDQFVIEQASALEASARPVYFPADGELIPAYHAELLLRDRSGENHAYGALIDARAGSGDAPPLWEADLTASEAFTYRVWADAQAPYTPADGPLIDSSPYPGATPDRKRPAFAAPVLVTIEGLNHNPQGRPDPWLPADATESRGNNVTAYTDRDAYVSAWGLPRRDGFTSGDVRADTTSPRTFDYSYDHALAPEANEAQLKASVTQVFYVNNWLHDFWYDSGFDEAAGNAQEDNYGRGGRDGDPMRAEAQDSAQAGATNNANMSVLSDGSSPRMQMYVWGGLPVRELVTEPALTFEDELGAAGYGPQSFDISGELVLVDDGSTAVAQDSGATQGSVTDACQRLPALSDRIAVVERGGCTFVVKIQNVERAGARAMLILDNAPGHIAVSPSVSDPPEVSIPILALSYEDGQKVKALLQGANEAPPRAARFYRGSEIMRDGTIDNTVVAHEWGHYMHHRLVSCASVSCAGMSEGWGDFLALMMVVREGDNFDQQVFPLSQYATGGLSQYSAYFGTRRAPYSTDLNKNPFTFKHVREASELPTGMPLAPTSAEMNEVHNVGEIWASMLFEAYANVIKAGQAAGRPFAESQRRMADYVVAGMKAAPVEPTFTQQRDAILSAVATMAEDDPSRVGDVEAIAQGFAKRGLGAGAVSPPVSSTTLNEAVESFELQPMAARAY